MFSAFRFDALQQRSGAALSRSFGGVQKRYCRAVGIDPSNGSRHFRGQNAPATKFLFQIATADKATAFPIIAEAIAVVNQAQLREASVQQLHARLNELNEAEHSADADEDRQAMRSVANPSIAQLEAAALADVHIAEITLERAAVLRELAERNRRNG